MNLDRRDDSGDTRRDYLLGEWRESGVRPEQLNEPAIPIQGRHVWHWFWRLSARRTAAYASVNPIQFSELTAFGQAYGIGLLPWEISALSAMDDAYMKTLSEKSSAVDGDPQDNADALKAGLLSFAQNNRNR